jgi:hypothetical protein
MQKCAKPKSRANPGLKTSRRIEYRLIDDLPDSFPVTEAELDLLTSELADFLEELLGT